MRTCPTREAGTKKPNGSMKVLGESMIWLLVGSFTSAPRPLGTSEALGAVTIPADSPVVATIEFAGAADVDYAVQAATA